MTMEEAGELVSQEILARVLQGNWSSTTYALIEAKTALDKATPKEVLEERGKFLCPCCRHLWQEELYCPDCGQALSAE